MKFAFRLVLACAALAFGALVIPSPARATWGVEGAPLRTAAGTQDDARAVGDGARGVIVVWAEQVGGLWDILAQRFDSTGTPKWGDDAVVICDAAGSQTAPRVCTDGAGGAIVVWVDARSGVSDIYARRVNASGVPQWTADGTVICMATGTQTEPAIVEDTFGGAIMTWRDGRGVSDDIYVQRVNAIGVVQWTGNGVALCLATGVQSSPAITNSGSSTATVAWRDLRNGVDYDIYARRITPAGAPQWTVNGVAVCALAGNQDTPNVLEESGGDPIVVWRDDRNGTTTDIYAQRLDASGTPQWTANGEVVCDATGQQEQVIAVPDGAGGAIAAWHDYRSGASRLHAQHIDGTGASLWTPDGIPILTVADDQFLSAMAPDGAGGAVLAIGVSGVSFDTYAQRLSSAGATLWGPAGVALAVQTSSQVGTTIAADGAGGAFCSWEDQRFSPRTSFVQRILPNGNLADVNPSITSVSDVPTDEGGWVRVALPRVLADQSGGGVTGYNVWRLVPNGTAASRFPLTDVRSVAEEARMLIARSVHERVRLSPVAAVAAAFPPGTWESMGFHAAVGSTSYLLLAPTRSDATMPDVADETYVVTAHTIYPEVFGVSTSSTGFSTDNLAPSMPANLAGQVIAPNTLHLFWDANTEDDLFHYAVYRGATADFVPGPGNRLGTPITPSFDDPGSDLASYYKVSAIDRHANESLFAVLAPGQVVAVPGPANPAVSFLAPCAPNPFVAGATLRFGLAHSGQVTLSVFDAAGRCVRVVAQGHRPAGEHRVFWDGRDARGAPVGPGVFWVRLSSPMVTAVRRIVRGG